jgi:hypothetical protein
MDSGQAAPPGAAGRPAPPAGPAAPTEPTQAGELVVAADAGMPAGRGESGGDHAAEPSRDGVRAAPSAPGAWLAAGAEALRQPGLPPQRIAELAVAEFGPRAAAWAGWLRATYPGAPEHGIVRLAVREAHRVGRVLAAAEAGGPLAAVLGLPAAAWVRVTVVLRIAAAHGHDPADPRRAAELLDLLGLAGPAGRATSPGPDRAVTSPGPDRAVTSPGPDRAVTSPGPDRAVTSPGPAGRATSPGPPRTAGFAGVAGRLGLTRLAVRRLVLRRTAAASALRVLVAASEQGERIDRLAHRAARFYRRAG